MRPLIPKFQIPKFASSAFKYTAANFLNAIVPILLLPVLTAYLSKEDYGLVSMFQVMIMIALPFIGLNSQGAIEREFFNDRYDFAEYITNAIAILSISGALIFLIFQIFGTTISLLVDFPVKFLWLVPTYCICHNVCEVLLSYWRVNNKPTTYGLFRVSRTLVEVGLSVFLVTVALKGWTGRLEGMAITAFIFGGLAIIFLFRARLMKFYWSAEQIKDILKFGVPLIPHTLGSVIMIYSDRIFITKMIGLADTGVYTVGYQVAMAISLLQSSFNLAWVPWFYEKLNQKSASINRQIVKFTYGYFLVILFCVAVLTISTPLIFKIFINKSYQDAIQFVFWIALGFAFDGMYKMVVNYIFYIKKTYIISLITLLTATLNLALNYILISRYGALGAAKATAISMFCEFVAVWWISKRIYPMPWLIKAN